jgi:hypothetical protein
VLTNQYMTILLPMILVIAAVINPILSFINSKRNGVAAAVLVTGLLSAGALGYLFILNYRTTKFLLFSAVSHAGGGL